MNPFDSTLMVVSALVAALWPLLCLPLCSLLFSLLCPLLCPLFCPLMGLLLRPPCVHFVFTLESPLLPALMFALASAVARYHFLSSINWGVFPIIIIQYAASSVGLSALQSVGRSVGQYYNVAFRISSLASKMLSSSRTCSLRIGFMRQKQSH